jgi:Tfp pilus assembly protein PilV
MQNTKNRLEKLESQQNASERPAYRSFTNEQWESMSAEQQEAACEDTKVYINLNPDWWDTLPPFAWATVDALARGETPQGYTAAQLEAMNRECFNVGALERMIKGTA